MWKNYLKIAYRNFLKNKVFTLINISGLALGIAICFIIYMWVDNELSYDRFNQNAENIYRVERGWDFQGMHGQGATASPPFGPAMVEDYEEIIDFLRLEKKEIYIKDLRNQYLKQKIFVSDNSIFSIFDFNLIKGDPQNALNQPNTVVITNELARKFLGTNDVIGKSLTIFWQDKPIDFQITGLLEEVPAHSHFDFELLVSISSYSNEILDDWFYNTFYIYILLQDNISPNEMELQFPSLLSKYLVADFIAFFGPDIDVNDVFKIKLKPLLDIHLNPTRNFEIAPQGDMNTVYIFSIIAILILTIACINFINLSTVHAHKRSHEVGMRKAIGASRHQLWKQFLGESFFSAIMSLLLAILIIEILIPLFNTLSGKEFSGLMIFHWKNLIILFLLTFTTGFIAGFYPAFVLSSVDPIKALRNSTIQKSGHWNFRNNMTVIQFVISITLIICTIIIYQQLVFFQNKSLGFDKENVIILSTESNAAKQNIEVFRNSLIQDSRIISITSTSNTLGNDIFWDTNFRRDDTDEFYNLLLLQTDYDFVRTYNIPFLQGRNFSRDHGTDKQQAFIINEQAAITLGYKPEEAIGKKLIMTMNTNEFKEGTIIGVIENFHFQSLHRRIEPLVLYLINPAATNAISVKVAAGNFHEIIDYIESTWHKIFPTKQLEYSFLENKLNLLYIGEKRIQNLFTIFAILSVFIACLGLFGLTVYTAENRRKEIGIRKVVGASVSGITLMLSRDFTKSVLWANIFAWPLAWYIMSEWLEYFAYRIDIGWLVFIFSGGVSIIIALATIVTQVIKASIANPVKSLRYE